MWRAAIACERRLGAVAGIARVSQVFVIKQNAAVQQKIWPHTMAPLPSRKSGLKLKSDPLVDTSLGNANIPRHAKMRNFQPPAG